MPQLIFTTIVRAGEAPLAHRLAEDLAVHHPGAPLHVLTLPPIGSTNAPPGDVGHAFAVGDLGLSAEQVALAQVALAPEELRMALAPALCARLLEDAEHPVVFLAPDTLLMGAVPDVPVDAIGLAARFLNLPDDDRTPSAADLAGMSTFDGGWLTVPPGARESLDRMSAAIWAHDVPVTDAVIHAWNTLPAQARCEVVDDAGTGVAYWNIPERGELMLDENTSGITSLRLPGFSPDRPHLLSSDQGDSPRVLLSEYPALRDHLLGHASRLRALGLTECANERFGDIEIDDHVRAAVIHAMNAEADVTAGCAAAIAAGPDAFGNWLAESPPGAATEGMSRYLLGVWASDDHARALFPNPLDDHAEPFLDWVRAHGATDAMPAALRPAVLPRAEARMAVPDGEALEPGVNLVGFLRAGFGIGEATRLFAQALDEGAVPHAAISLNHQDLQDLVALDGGSDAPRFDTNLICVNVDWLDLVSRRLGSNFLTSRYTIGTWWWESNVLPERLAQRIPDFDELWVGSHFIADALASYAQIPIRVFPLPIPVPPDAPAANRNALGLPEGFLFMFSFDFNSTVERKNPAGVIEAFTMAFAPDDGAALVIKTINGHRHLAALEELRALASGRPDIQIVDRFLSADQRDAWARACDCYVSLHRCEGFGLTMAEAMALGKPVIATAYSANLDFMDSSTALLVGYDEWVLSRQSGPYPPGTRWAQPNVGEAAAFMRQLYDDPKSGRMLGERAREHIRTTRTHAALAGFVRDRLEEIRMTEPRANGDAWNEPLPGPLQDAMNYDGARRRATRGIQGRAVERLVKPYSAPADAMIERLLATDEWIFTNGERRDRGIERRLDEVERAIVRLASEARVVEQRAHDDLTRAVDDLSDRLYPRLYMDTPGELLLTTDGGDQVLGYDTDTGHVDASETYADFEDVFRGPPDRVKPGLMPYVDLLAGHDPILDVGCGRGEMLDLLARAGLQASGVDSDAGMVGRARKRGLDVVEGDATEHLRNVIPAGSLGAIFSAQVVEHIPWPALAEFLTASHAALRPGGLFIAETVNPHCLQSLKAFWLDPTHQHPLFPEAMLVFCRQAGFGRAWVRFTNDAGTLEESRRGSTSYAIVASRTH